MARVLFLFALNAIVLNGSSRAADQTAAISGELKVWHPLEVTFQGPAAAETDNAPNPFLDQRLQVQFRAPDGRTFDVPGFFDGPAQDKPVASLWRVRFTPNAPGRWTFHASFRAGPAIAIDLNPDAGTPLSFDGASGEFQVATRDLTSPGFLRWGRLGYAGGHYLKFQDGPYWLKGGTDEPENFLAYKGFINTRTSHDYAAHEDDWRPGDPDWGDGQGRAIIGALNALAARHVNSLYFLLMNIGGDGKDVWPWAGTPDRNGSPNNDNLHYDVRKLAQWETVFAHAQRKGIVLHFVFNEAEAKNKRELDDGELGVERKLYYREMVARFGHHPALQWNLCEEYNLDFNLGPDRVRAFAQYLRSVDPYDHPITVHSAGDPLKALAFTFGDPIFGLTSVQLNQRRIDVITEQIREATARAGRPLPASMDEFTVDQGQASSATPVDAPSLMRKQKLWPTYLSGGTIEYILEGLLKVNNFKTPERESLWADLWHARSFLEELPFWRMKPDDRLSRGAATIDVGIGRGRTTPMGAQVFCVPGEVYAAYLPRANPSGEINLADGMTDFTKRWYNPRTGIFEGETEVIQPKEWVPFGSPPTEPDEDWVVLLQSANLAEPLGQGVFPKGSWETKPPADLSLDQEPLDELAKRLGGRGCVIKNGYVVKAWGAQDQRSDWFSSAKPVLSTLLLFALKEGKITSVDQPVREFGWELQPKDRDMTLRHLASMTSGYARPERPGEAWSYNDFAIQLYQKTLFDRIFKGDPDEVANHPDRFGALGLQDKLAFRKSNRRLSASVRDFARIAWFWLRRGEWDGRQILSRDDFVQYCRPQVPKDLPLTQASKTDDYLKVGTYGGGSDHFSQAGPGVYGFNWWFNQTGRDHPDRLTWPGAPRDLFMSVGAGGNCAAILPSFNAVVVAAGANWGSLAGGDESSRLNRNLALFARAVRLTR
jgi:CubicO group peptidase (beta-lactamase class C family)